MFLPEELYHNGLTERDMAGRPFSFFTEYKLAAAASATPTAVFTTIPVDRALAVQSITANFIGGGAQTCDFHGIYLVKGGSTIYLAQEYITAANESSFSYNEELIIPPGWSISVAGRFNAGVAANQINAFINGWLIPAAGLS